VLRATIEKSRHSLIPLQIIVKCRLSVKVAFQNYLKEAFLFPELRQKS